MYFIKKTKKVICFFYHFIKGQEVQNSYTSWETCAYLFIFMCLYLY